MFTRTIKVWPNYIGAILLNARLFSHRFEEKKGLFTDKQYKPIFPSTKLVK